MKGVRGLQQLDGNAFGFELVAQGFDGGERAGGHASGRAVVCRQLDAGRQALRERLRPDSRTESMAPAGRACMSAPRRATRRAASGKVMTPASTAATNSPTLWPTSADGTSCNASHWRAIAYSSTKVAGCVTDVGARAAGSGENMRSRKSNASASSNAARTFVEGRTEDGIAGIQRTPHARVLRTLARKHQHGLRHARAGRTARAEQASPRRARRSLLRAD